MLVTNRRMLSLLRSRGFAVMEHSEQPAVVRVVISTAGRVPSWASGHDRPRLLVEVRGGRWREAGAAHSAGFEVLACPGPVGKWSGCPALRGEPCPLASGADLIVDAMPGEPGQSLLEAHRRLHPSVPVCIDVAGEDDDDSADPSVPRIPRRAEEAVVIGLLQRLAGPSSHSEPGVPS